MSDYRYLILGGGMVAGYAATAFAAQGLQPGELCIVSREASPPYERPPLSKTFLAGEVQPEEILIHAAGFYREHGIDLRLNTAVTQVDFKHRRLITAGGEALGYDKLLLAPGVRVRELELPGAGLEGVQYLRSLADASALRERAARARQALVIGGGYLGLEVSASLARQGLPTTVLLRGETLLPRLFTPQMSAFFQGYYEQRGVGFVKQAELTAIEGQARAAGVRLASGQLLAGDLVVAGIGVVPDTRLFERTALKLDRGIVVNEYLETSLPGVYAAGDAVAYWDLLSHSRRHVEHWNNATEGGKHVAGVMMGRREPYRQLPYFFSDIFDLSWEFWGDSEGHDQVLYRGDPATPSFSTWWLKEGRLCAAFVMKRPDEERELAPRWIEARQQLSPQLLQDAAQPLAASLCT